MTQLSNTLNNTIFKETPASTAFFSYLASDLFYSILLILSFFFTSWSYQLLQQTNPAAVENMAITSLESKIAADGQAEYFVAYSLPAGTFSADQAASIQTKQIPESLYLELQNSTDLPVNILSTNPLQTEIVAQALRHDRTTNTIIPTLMVLLGLAVTSVSMILLLRSVQFSVESIKLNRYGVMTYGVIRKRSMEKHKDRESEYNLIYQFEMNGGADCIQAKQSVTYNRFNYMQIGEVVRVRYNPKEPHVSRIEF